MKKRESNIPVHRIHLIDEEIRRGTYPNKKILAKKLEVSERTIFRDLEFLRNFYNAPMEFDATRNGFYYTDPDFYVKSVTLSEGELFSISLFDKLLSQYKNTPLEKKLKSIFEKITLSLPDSVQVDSGFLSKDITTISEPMPVIDVNVFSKIMESLQSRTTIEFDHYSLDDSQKKNRSIDPYHICCKGGSWYVIGFCHKREEVRIFALNRISNVRITKLHYSIPKNFKVGNYIDSGMGVWASEKIKYKIRIKCSKKLATVAREYKWHPNQELEIQEDGSVVVSFETTQMHETLKLVMSLGSDAVVLEPEELADLVVESAQNILSNYKKKA